MPGTYSPQVLETIPSQAFLSSIPKLAGFPDNFLGFGAMRWWQDAHSEFVGGGLMSSGSAPCALWHAY
jgi:hypothetical protein